MMKKNRILIIFFVLIWNACQCCTYHQSKEQKSTTKEVNEINVKDSIIRIDGSIGVITTSDKYAFGDSILVFDEQKRPLSTIVIKDEYQNLTLKCLSTEGDFYKVLLEDSVIGYLAKSQPIISFQTWSEHVLSVFAVGFDTKRNPIKKEPNNLSSEISYDLDEFYHPVKVQGNWLQIKWGTEGNWQYGWIKWKDKDKLIIELFYFA